MNRLTNLFSKKKSDILNIYFTAGFPKLDDTVAIIQSLEESGADLIELGMPYSDPLADGETIQKSSSVALKNGMELDILFGQVKTLREHSQIPVMLMGYYNQVIQYGQDKFLDNCVDAGVDGLIIPDIPMDYYTSYVQSALENRNLLMTFLVTPETSDERIRQADQLSTAFLYVVSKSSITGGTNEVNSNQEEYFKRLDELQLQAPRLIGFGIHNAETFAQASKNANGAIIGSAFIRMLEKEGLNGINSFITRIRRI